MKRIITEVYGGYVTWRDLYEKEAAENERLRAEIARLKGADNG